MQCRALAYTFGHINHTYRIQKLSKHLSILSYKILEYLYLNYAPSKRSKEKLVLINSTSCPSTKARNSSDTRSDVNLERVSGHSDCIHAYQQQAGRIMTRLLAYQQQAGRIMTRLLA